MVSAAGIGSGLDVGLIVTQLMEHESQPLVALQDQRSQLKAQLSAYGTLKNSLSNFKNKLSALDDLAAFVKHQAVSSDSEVLEASTNEYATHGQHAISINALATAHQTVSTGFADATTSTGMEGTLQLAVNGESFQIAVDSSNDSLNAIKNAINNADDNIGVKASLIYVDDGLGGTESRLVLASEATGAANTLSLTDLSGNVAATLSSATQTVATDASLVVDGFTVTRPANVLDDVLEGVTLTLKQAGASADLSVERDLDAVKASVQEFVDAYNELMNTINKLHGNELSNDFSLNTMKSQLRSKLNSMVEDVGAYQLLTEVGVHAEMIGSKATDKLTLDDSELTDALSKNFASVANLFAAKDKGIANGLLNSIDDFLDAEGMVKVREEGIGRRIKTIGEQVIRQEDRLDKIEERYMKQFGALDALLSQLQSTNAFLTQQISAFENVAIGKKR